MQNYKKHIFQYKKMKRHQQMRKCNLFLDGNFYLCDKFRLFVSLINDKIVLNYDGSTIKSRLPHLSTGQNSVDSSDSAFYDPSDPKAISSRSTPTSSFYHKIKQEVRASSCSSYHQNPPCAIMEKELIITKGRLAMSLNKESLN